MRSIGFKFDKDGFTYVVLESQGTDLEIVHAVQCRADTALDGAEKLQWFAREVQSVLGKHAVDAAAFRAMEVHTGSSARIAPRAEIEGVAQLAALEHSLKVVLTPVRLARIKSKFGVRTKDGLRSAIDDRYPPGLAKKYEDAFSVAAAGLK